MNAFIRGGDPLGHEICAAYVACCEDLGIQELVFNSRIWNPDDGWRSYSGSNPHRDHVHAGQNWQFARGLTITRALQVLEDFMGMNEADHERIERALSALQKTILETVDRMIDNRMDLLAKGPITDERTGERRWDSLADQIDHQVGPIVLAAKKEILAAVNR